MFEGLQSDVNNSKYTNMNWLCVTCFVVGSFVCFFVLFSDALFAASVHSSV